ncbi:unnamed protein product [Didymodactylos carnosus]|uniref:Uncharacterized protein n=1 Tax=Didymodactylos carnosus TaxID=1234261 RepID=A0A8S2E2E1_9BILA|nr:unnamed protein product [Didymodactylos carnosus]CAF3885345.1 unnamed protein product [Didymodactylos carnosus]
MQVLFTYIMLVLIIVLNIKIVMANKDREAFTDLLQKRKHLNGYWVGKRANMDEDIYDTDAETVHPVELLDGDHFAAKRSSYLIGKRGTYLVGRDTDKPASYRSNGHVGI